MLLHRPILQGLVLLHCYVNPLLRRRVCRGKRKGDPGFRLDSAVPESETARLAYPTRTQLHRMKKKNPIAGIREENAVYTGTGLGSPAANMRARSAMWPDRRVESWELELHFRPPCTGPSTTICPHSAQKVPRGSATARSVPFSALSKHRLSAAVLWCRVAFFFFSDGLAWWDGSG
jgi:hypothetical protein